MYANARIRPGEGLDDGAEQIRVSIERIPATNPGRPTGGWLDDAIVASSVCGMGDRHEGRSEPGVFYGGRLGGIADAGAGLERPPGERRRGVDP